MVVIVLPRKDGTGEVNVTVRGMMPDGLEMRQLPADKPRVKLVEGRWFSPGQREVVVSTSIHKRFSNSNVGDTMDFGKGPWKVVGIFDAGGSAYESEIWGDVNQMASDFDRQGAFASAYLRATDPQPRCALKDARQRRPAFEIGRHARDRLLREANQFRRADQVCGLRCGLIMGIGSIFAAMNTMYAAVAYRSREIATLRVIGFCGRAS